MRSGPRSVTIGARRFDSRYIAVLAVLALALATAGESHAATVTVGVDTAHPGRGAPAVRSDFVGVSIPYYLLPSMLSYFPIDVESHRRFARPWPAPPAPRNQKVLNMLAGLGHGTLRVGGTAQEQMCYFNQRLGSGCSFKSRVVARHFALVKDFLLDLKARDRNWTAMLGVPLADGAASVRKTIVKGINAGFTGSEHPGVVLRDNRRLIRFVAVGHEPNSYRRSDYLRLRSIAPGRKAKKARPGKRGARPGKRRPRSGRNRRFATNQRYRVAARRLLTRGRAKGPGRHFRWTGRRMAGPGLPTYSAWRGRLGAMIAAGGYRFVTQSVYQARGRRGCIQDLTKSGRRPGRCWSSPGLPGGRDRRAEFLLAEPPLRRLGRLVGQAVRYARGRDVYAVEANSVSKRGSRGVSDTMVNALWGLDWMFTMAARGVRGVNIQHADRWDNNPLLRPGGHGFAPYNPIGLTNGAIDAKPLYYAMLLFGQYATGTAAGRSQARIERLKPDGPTTIKAWRARAGQTNSVFLINKDASVAPATTDDVVRLAPSSPAADCYALWLRGDDGTIKSPTASLGNPLENRWARVDAEGNVPEWHWRRIEPENGQYPIPMRRGDAVVVRFW